MRACGKIDASTRAALLTTSTAGHGGSYMHVFSRIFSLKSRSWLLAISAADLKIDQMPPGLFHPLLALIELLVVVGLGMGTELNESSIFGTGEESRMLGNEFSGEE